MSRSGRSESPPVKEAPTILLVGQRQEDCASLLDILRRSNWKLTRASSPAEASVLMSKQVIPVVLCEPGLSGGGWEALIEISSRLPRPPRLIVYSWLADERLWGQVLNLGGWDVLAVPFVPEEVFRVVDLAWDSWSRAGSSAARDVTGHSPRTPSLPGSPSAFPDPPAPAQTPSPVAAPSA